MTMESQHMATFTGQQTVGEKLPGFANKLVKTSIGDGEHNDVRWVIYRTEGRGSSCWFVAHKFDVTYSSRGLQSTLSSHGATQ
ncbi:hypothetical protein LSAT2_015552 [Lamellibrachia satsuma]|nr:hypothetical protein LSAT2_015552 [Lamellibrachia satsuma]